MPFDITAWGFILTFRAFFEQQDCYRFFNVAGHLLGRINNS